jgi:hypothetical protein
MADNTNTCPGCGTKFSTFKWKHQCHRCNAVRCHDCSSHKMPIPKLGITKPERVCDPCYIALNLALKNTTDLEQFPVKTLKQFALDYNIPAALTNALEKSDIIAGLLKYYDPNQDKTHERALKDRQKKEKKKQQKPSAAEYPGNVHTNNYNHSNSSHSNKPQQSNPQQNQSENFFDSFAGFFNGGSPQVQNNQQQQTHNRPNTSSNNSGDGFNGFFESVLGSIFPQNAHPFNPPPQHQSATAHTNVHYHTSTPSNNGGSVGSAPSYNYNSSQQNFQANGQPNVNTTNYGNNGHYNGSNGQSQQQSATRPQQQAPSRSDPAPQAPVTEVIIPENFELHELSVAQLKEILKRHRVDFKDCVEKSDLIQKIQDRIMKKTSDADKKPTNTSNNNNNNANYDTVYDAQSHSNGSEDKDICVICQDRHIKCVFLECGHLACCMECSVKVQHCPLCRKYISRVVEIYHAYK